MLVWICINRAIIAAKKRKDLNQLMAGPEANTFFWGPFAVFGYGNQSCSAKAFLETVPEQG